MAAYIQFLFQQCHFPLSYRHNFPGWNLTCCPNSTRVTIMRSCEGFNPGSPIVFALVVKLHSIIPTISCNVVTIVSPNTTSLTRNPEVLQCHKVPESWCWILETAPLQPSHALACSAAVVSVMGSYQIQVHN